MRPTYKNKDTFSYHILSQTDILTKNVSTTVKNQTYIWLFKENRLYDMKFIFIKPEQFAYTFKIHIMQSPEIYLDFVEREKVDDKNFARSI